MDVLYWFSIPFVSAFNVSEVFIIPLVTALCATFFYALLRRLEEFRLGILEGLLGVFLGSVVLSTFINAYTIDAKGINHLIAVFACYAVFYYLVVCISRDITIEKILAVLWGGYIFTTVFGLVEFVLANFAGMDLSFIPRPNVVDYTPGFLDILLIRSRSLFEESGYYAAYLSIVAPLLTYYLWCVKPSRMGKTVFIVLSLSSYFVAFSVSLFIFLPLAVLLPSITRVLAQGRITRRAVWSFTAIACVVILILSSDTLMDILFYRKFSSGSFEDRSDKFEATLGLMAGADWINLLFGYGPGSYFRLGVLPAISVYLNYWRDFGMVGLGAYCVFVAVFLRRCYADRSALGKAIFISAIVIQLYYIAMPAYFLPGYFIPLVLHKIKTLRDRRMRMESADVSLTVCAG